MDHKWKYLFHVFARFFFQTTARTKPKRTNPFPLMWNIPQEPWFSRRSTHPPGPFGLWSARARPFSTIFPTTAHPQKSIRSTSLIKYECSACENPWLYPLVISQRKMEHCHYSWFTCQKWWIFQFHMWNHQRVHCPSKPMVIDLR